MNAKALAGLAVIVALLAGWLVISMTNAEPVDTSVGSEQVAEEVDTGATQVEGDDMELVETAVGIQEPLETSVGIAE